MSGPASSGGASEDELARGELGGFHVVDPDLYEKYRDQILELGNSHQRNIQEFLTPDTRQRAWTDAEIAEHLGLDIRDVTETLRDSPSKGIAQLWRRHRRPP